METKILMKYKTKMESGEIFRKKTEEELNEYLNNGWTIISSNMQVTNDYIYVYFLLQK